ncbi:MAG TPA: CRISPR-associated protein Csx19 [Ktedonobacteraceae bacterium]|nr:CRISPR-associated protein Csx19 [Ktedonobacteraceae bacterium]
MEEILASGPVDDIAALITACGFSSAAFVLTENFPQHQINDQRERQNLLRFARRADGINVNNTTSGRVFDQSAELRWEKKNDKYWAVYLGEKRDLPALNVNNKPLEGLQKHEAAKKYYLFGELLDPNRLRSMGLEGTTGYYAEVRIPRLLHYPAPSNAQRVQLVVCEYIEATTGNVQLFRFQDLKSEEER